MNFQKLFPRYQTLGENWRARLLGTILSLAFPLTLFLLVVFLFATRGLSIEVLLFVIGLAFEVAVWLLWRRFGLNVAAQVFVLGAFALVSGCIYFSGGIASVLLVAQAFLVIATALLTTPRLTGVLVAATIAFDVLLSLDGSQLAIPPALNDSPLIRLSLQTAILLITAGTIVHSNRILQALTLNLVNSEYRFRSLFERTSDAVFLTGLDLHLMEVNDQAAKLLEYTSEELVGLPVKKLFPSDEWSEVQRRFESVNGNDFLAPTIRRFLTKGGDELMMETNLSLIHDAGGKGASRARSTKPGKGAPRIRRSKSSTGSASGSVP